MHGGNPDISSALAYTHRVWAASTWLAPGAATASTRTGSSRRSRWRSSWERACPGPRARCRPRSASPTSWRWPPSTASRRRRSPSAACASCSRMGRSWPTEAQRAVSLRWLQVTATSAIDLHQGSGRGVGVSCTGADWLCAVQGKRSCRCAERPNHRQRCGLPGMLAGWQLC